MSWPQIAYPAAQQLSEGLSRAIYERLDLAFNWGVTQGEETITDILALDLIRANLPGLSMTKVTRPREGRDGMDWLLAVHLPVGWIEIAVQAKRIDRTGNYPQLEHFAKTTKVRQIDLLNRYCKAAGALPAYALYNVPPTSFLASWWHCPLTPVQIPQLGCSLVSEATIRGALNAKTTDFASIHRFPDAIPFRCLFHRHPGNALGAIASERIASPTSITVFGNSITVLPSNPLAGLVDRAAGFVELNPSQFPEGQLPSWIVVIDPPGT